MILDIALSDIMTEEMEALLTEHNLKAIGAALIVEPYATATRKHIVKIGEKLGKIAKLYGVNTTELARINNIKDPNVIHVGQILEIPNGGKHK